MSDKSWHTSWNHPHLRRPQNEFPASNLREAPSDTSLKYWRSCTRPAVPMWHLMQALSLPGELTVATLWTWRGCTIREPGLIEQNLTLVMDNGHAWRLLIHTMKGRLLRTCTQPLWRLKLGRVLWNPPWKWNNWAVASWYLGRGSHCQLPAHRHTLVSTQIIKRNASPPIHFAEGPLKIAQTNRDGVAPVECT